MGWEWATRFLSSSKTFTLACTFIYIVFQIQIVFLFFKKIIKNIFLLCYEWHDKLKSSQLMGRAHDQTRAA